MTKIAKKPDKKSTPKPAKKLGSQLSFFDPVFEARKPPALDTLAQLSCKNPKTAKSAQFDGFGKLSESGHKTLEKRAKAKWMSDGIAAKLYYLESDLKRAYGRTFDCAKNLLQSGQKITGHYCNSRWCIVCNRIRTAKLIIAYLPVLEPLPDKQFVTLTIPTVPAAELYITVRNMNLELRRIQNSVFRQRGTPIVGVRKLECTYRPITDLYHPHYHLVVSGAQVSADLVLEWLKTFPKATRAAQDIRPGDNNSVKELFKYFTKLLTRTTDGGETKETKVYPGALDVIFTAMKGLRVFQAMGVTAEIPEDIEEIQAEIYRDIEQAEMLWEWTGNGWTDKTTGEVLADYTPSETIKKLLL